MTQWKRPFEQHNAGLLYIHHEQITDDKIAYAFVDPKGKYGPETGIVIYELTEDGENWDNPLAYLADWHAVKQWTKDNK